MTTSKETITGSAIDATAWLKAIAQGLTLRNIALPLANAQRMLTDPNMPVIEQLQPLISQLGLDVECTEIDDLQHIHLASLGAIIVINDDMLAIKGYEDQPYLVTEAHLPPEQRLHSVQRLSSLPANNVIVVYEFFPQLQNAQLLSSAESVHADQASSNQSTNTKTQALGWTALWQEIHQARWLMTPLKQHSPLFRELVFAAMLLNTLSLVGPFFSMHLYDRIVPNTSTDTLWMMVIGVVIAYGFDSALKIARHYLLDTAGQRVDIQVSEAISQKIFAVKLADAPAQPAQFLHQYKTFEALRDLLSSSAVTALVDLPFMLLYIIIAGLIHWALAIPLIISTVLALSVTWVGYHALRKHSQHALGNAAENHALWLETLQGLETLKAFSAGPWSNQRLVESTLKARQTSTHLRHVNYVIGLWAGLLQQLAWISVLIIGVYLIMQSSLSVGALIATSMLAMRCAGPIAQWIGVLLQINTVHSGFTALNEFMMSREEINPSQAALKTDRLHLKIDQLRVKFRGQSNPILKSINLDIPPGQRIALIGHMGSGKTTLLKTIAGFLHLDHGQVLINQRDLHQWQPSDLHDRIAYLGQHPTLFKGTLRDNLKLGRYWLSDDACYRALQAAGIESLAAQSSKGLDRWIDEGGCNLSGGQRQAIALARILLTQPAVVLLDEPANALDGNAEESLKQTVAKLPAHTTVIIATHKMSLLSMTDRLILLHNGEILLDGPNESVLATMRQGPVQKVAESQASIQPSVRSAA